LKNQYIFKITTAGLLIAIGMIIPIFSPFKILIEPASYTLASHVAIFVAMFISPAVAVAVAIGTALGFYLSGFFPFIVVLRAATHIAFAFLGAFYIHRVAKNRLSTVKLRVFSLFVGLIHAWGEIIVVSFFIFNGVIEQGFTSVLLLVGLGTVIHSMVDFEIARIVILPLKRQKHLREFFGKC